MIGLGPLRRRRTNAPDSGLGNHYLASVGITSDSTDKDTGGIEVFDQLDIMSCRDRTSEFVSAIKSLQSRQVG